jgi:hypothetical protein
MYRLILAGFIFFAGGASSHASAVKDQPDLAVPDGEWRVVALRRASDVSGPPDSGDDRDLMGQAVSFGSSLAWLDGTTCANWAMVRSETSRHVSHHSVMPDVLLWPLNNRLSDGDRRVWQDNDITCEGTVIAQVIRVDNRVMVASSADGLLNIVIEKPLSTRQVARLQMHLKQMGLYGSHLAIVNGVMDAATRKAVASYAAHRSRGAKYVFADPVITENLLDGLGVLNSQGVDHQPEAQHSSFSLARAIPWTLEDDGFYRASLTRDVDGDGVDDIFSLERGYSQNLATTFASLKLSASGRVIEIVTTTLNYQMINFHKLPQDLMAPGMEAARRFFEEALFGATQDERDPSLQVLVGGAAAATWQRGRPSIFNNYAIILNAKDYTFLADTPEISFPKSARVQFESALAEFVERSDDGNGVGPVWMEYHSDIQRFNKVDARPDPDLTQTLDEAEHYSLLGTRNGVILYDKVHDRHAWLFVTFEVSLEIPNDYLHAKFTGENTVDIHLPPPCGPFEDCAEIIHVISLEGLIER